MITPYISVRGKVNSGINVKGKIGHATEKLYPELEDLHIIPSGEEQTFKSDDKYGFNEVTVEGISAAVDEDIQPENIRLGKNILGVDGIFDGIDTSDATATSDDILEGKTAYVNKQKLEGTVRKYDGTYIGNTNSGVNIFVQEEEPTIKEGIWIQSSDLIYDRVLASEQIDEETLYPDNSIVLLTSKSGYSTKIIPSNLIDSIYTIFSDAWYNTSKNGLNKTLPTYYGDGEKWINFKNSRYHTEIEGMLTTKEIVTDYIPNSNTRLVIDYTFNSSGVNANTWYKLIYADDKYYFTFRTHGMFWYMYYNGVKSNTGNWDYAKDFKGTHTIELDKGNFLLDGALVYEQPNNTLSGISDVLRINTYSTSDQYQGILPNFIIHSIKIYENDVLVRDYIPVVKNDIEMLYEKMSQTYC